MLEELKHFLLQFCCYVKVY